MTDSELRDEMDRVAELILSHRLTVNDEYELQAALGDLLGGAGIAFEREKLLGEAGRIDFFLPVGSIGLETKVAGSPSEVLEQVIRYAHRPEISGLMLVTNKDSVARMVPDRLGPKESRKPVRVVSLWRTQL